MFPPARIICLTEETTETLYLLGEQERIVGISGYTVRPWQARREKPRVSAYISADIPKILALKPDLVLAFSDMQADIAASLVRAGIAVHVFNQRTIAEIMDMILTLGALVSATQRAQTLVDSLWQGLQAVQDRTASRRYRPKTYFEEWNDPLISCSAWVSELIAVAGGDDIFPERASCKSGADRIVSAGEVIQGMPDIIIGSWCGKKFNKDRVSERPGFNSIPAVRNNQLFEIKSAIILQPGPAALTDGLTAMTNIIAAYPGSA